eukprot:CAMPEP_0204256642 /NCGR_PEP_ID=MMETSP0468-20130131/3914_1 /ASSEMBLY_ACC=CAM_ASM_000383 /TAXON_ID=2969 /ORGANISM="Oxyrrhis marina" /LENGTH=47 /DNA_ID= /DNA_START= /DNA_END= /DNA_ORIENTATION=
MEWAAAVLLVLLVALVYAFRKCRGSGMLADIEQEGGMKTTIRHEADL